MHELIVRMSGSAADVLDAYNQIVARMTNATVAGIGTPGVRTSYARVDEIGVGLVAMVHVDEHGIVRSGEYIAPDPHPAWVQPTGAHDSYPVLRLDGEPTRVLHNGQAWENSSGTVNSWEPGVFGWTQV